MNASSRNLPFRFKLITLLASLYLLPAFILLFFLPNLLKTYSSTAEALFVFLRGLLSFGVLILPYYALAGGLEWRRRKLPTTRAVLFWVFSLGAGGLVLWGSWILVRRGMAKIYHLSYEQVTGRLLNRHPEEEPEYHSLRRPGAQGGKGLSRNAALFLTALLILAVGMVAYFAMYAPKPLNTSQPPKLGHYVQTGGVTISFDVTADGIANLQVSGVTDTYKTDPPTPVFCTLNGVGNLALDDNSSFYYMDNAGTAVSGTVHGNRARGVFKNHAAGAGCKSWAADHQRYNWEQFELQWQAELVEP